MYQLFHQYVQIAMLKLAPQDLPGQPLSLALAALAAFVTGLAGLLFAYEFYEAIYRSVLALVVPAGLLYVLLKGRGLESRYVQSFSAMCGSAAVVYLVTLPLTPYIINSTVDSQSGGIAVFLVVLINIWALMITVHILKHTLNTGFSTALSVSLLMMLITVIVVESLVPTKQVVQSNLELGQNTRVVFNVVGVSNPLSG